MATGKFSAYPINDGGYNRVFLESPAGDRAIFALQGGSMEGLRFNYPSLGDPAELVFPHESYDELREKPTLRGGAILSMNNRTEDGMFQVIDPRTKRLAWTMELEKNCPGDDPKDHLHGDARYAAFSNTFLKPYDDKAVAVLDYVTPEPKNPRGMPANILYKMTSILRKGVLDEYALVRNGSKKIIPVCIGRHQSWRIPYKEMEPSTPIDELEFQIDSHNMLEVNDPKYLNPTGKLLPLNGHPLDFSRMRKLGNTVFNNTLVMDPGSKPEERTARIFNREYGIGVGIGCGNGVDHTTVWTKDMNPGRRELFAVEPGNRHSGSGKHPMELGQVSLNPDDWIRFHWRFVPIELSDL